MHRYFSVPINATKVSRYGGFQYLYFDKENVTYWQAKANCEKIGATLLIIKDNDTQQHIQDNMPINKNCGRSFYYMGLFLNGSDWMWPDGSYLNNQSFTRWRIREPNNISSCLNEPNGHRGCDAQPQANASQISSCPKNTNANIGDWFDKLETKSMWHHICQKEYVSNLEVTTIAEPTTKSK